MIILLLLLYLSDDTSYLLQHRILLYSLTLSHHLYRWAVDHYNLLGVFCLGLLVGLVVVLGLIVFVVVVVSILVSIIVSIIVNIPVRVVVAIAHRLVDIRMSLLLVSTFCISVATTTPPTSQLALTYLIQVVQFQPTTTNITRTSIINKKHLLLFITLLLLFLYTLDMTIRLPLPL